MAYVKGTKRKDQDLDFEASKVMNRFLGRLRTQSTQYTYKSQLKKYFEFLKVSPDDYINNRKTDKEYKDDIFDYAVFLRKAGKSPNAQSGAVFCVKVFLRRNDIELNNGFWDDLFNSAVDVKNNIIVDHVPTQKELKQILQHAELKGRALFLMMASSGLRINEAVNLTFDDVDLTRNPAKIIVPFGMAKTSKRRTTFMSNEARNAVIQWCVNKSKHQDDNGITYEMTPRDFYIRTAISKCNIPNRKPVNDNRIFPFSSVNARRIWNRLIRDAGLNDKDKNSSCHDYHKIHPHCLRKFFRTQLSTEIPVDVIESMMGHESLHGYRQLSDAVLAEQYEQGVHKLLAFEFQAEPSELVKQQEQEITRLQEEVARMNDALKEITDKMGHQYEQEAEAIKQYNAEMTKTIKMTPEQLQEITDAGSLEEWARRKRENIKN